MMSPPAGRTSPTVRPSPPGSPVQGRSSNVDGGDGKNRRAQAAQEDDQLVHDRQRQLDLDHFDHRLLRPGAEADAETQRQTPRQARTCTHRLASRAASWTASWLRPRRERAIAFRVASRPCVPNAAFPKRLGVLAAIGTASRSSVPTKRGDCDCVLGATKEHITCLEMEGFI